MLMVCLTVGGELDPEDQVRSAALSGHMGPQRTGSSRLPWRGVQLGPQVIPDEVEKLRELRLVFVSIKISAVL